MDHSGIVDRSVAAAAAPTTDVTLSCCEEHEAEINARRTATESILRLHDRVASLERHHQINVVPNSNRYRCYNTMEDDGDYPALREYRHHLMVESDSEDEASLPDDVTGCAVAGASLDGEETEEEDEDDEYDYLLEETTLNITNVEEERRLEMKLRGLHLDIARGHGYGVHRHINPGNVWEQAGLNSPNPPQAAIVHLYDPTSIPSAKLDVILESNRFAAKYKGTKFLKADGKKAVSANPIVPKDCLPCIMAIRNGTIIATCDKLRDVMDRHYNVVDEWALEEWLDRANVLIREAPEIDNLVRIRPEEEALLDSIRRENEQTSASTEKIVEKEYYDCGLEGCQKTFCHQHIGNGEKGSTAGYVVPPQYITPSEQIDQS